VKFQFYGNEIEINLQETNTSLTESQITLFIFLQSNGTIMIDTNTVVDFGSYHHVMIWKVIECINYFIYDVHRIVKGNLLAATALLSFVL